MKMIAKMHSAFWLDFSSQEKVKQVFHTEISYALFQSNCDGPMKAITFLSIRTHLGFVLTITNHNAVL